MTTSTTTALLITTLFTATTALQADTFDVPSGGDIQAAIDIATDGDLVQLSAGTYQPGSALVMDDKAITIRGVLDGQGQPASVIDAQSAHRVFFIDSGTDAVTLENLQIVNGQPNASEPDSSRGGGIYAPGNARLVIRSCWLTDNRAVIGGAFYCLGNQPRLVFNDCLFTRNEDGGAGGAAIASAFLNAPDPATTPSCLIEGCRFIDNENTGLRGVVATGFVSNNHVLVLRTCEFAGNIGSATVYTEGAGSLTTLIDECTFNDRTGHAIQWNAGDLTIRNSTLNGQTDAFSVGVQPFSLVPELKSLLIEDSAFLGFSAGAINLSDQYVSSVESCDIRSTAFRNNRGRRAVDVTGMDAVRANFTDCVFTQNFSDDVSGGAVEGDRVEFLRCGWSGNASGGGAAILADDVEINDCFFDENFTGTDGGVVKTTSLRALDCDFTNNASQGSGGALVVAEGTASITDCYFFRNFASSGGALQMDDAQEVEIVNSHFERHEASGSGGAILIDYDNPGVGNQLRLDNCKFIDNTGLLGGAIFNDGFTLPDVRDTLFCRNSLDQIFGQFNDLGGNTFENEGNCIVVPGDFDGNLVVDGADLAVLLGDWGPCTSGGCSADLDGNGTVNGADLSIVLGNWGPHDA